jgi:hypothetical protein
MSRSGRSGPGLGASDSFCGRLAIVNGSILARGGEEAAGIGIARSVNARIGGLTIENADVNGRTSTSSLYRGAAIRTSDSSAVEWVIVNLTIANANMTGRSHTSGNYGGSGIGTGSHFQGNARIGNLTIENANVSGYSSTDGNEGESGIGASAASNSGIGELRLVGGVSLLGDSLWATSVLVQDKRVFVFPPGDRLFYGTLKLLGTVFLMILYGTEKAEAQEPALIGFPSIAIGNLSLLDHSAWRFCVSGAICSESIYETLRGLFILVPDAGACSIIAEGLSRGFWGF